MTSPIGDEHRRDDGLTTFVRVNPDGSLRGVTRVAHDIAAFHQAAAPGDIALDAIESGKLIGNDLAWRLEDGVLFPRADAGFPLEERRRAAMALIDQGAERCRLAWITPGAGQAMEYAATQADAARALAAPDPLNPADHPWLEAERLALASAGRVATLRQIAGGVLASEAAWAIAGADIKRLRRTLKLALAEAASATDIDIILAAIVWPTP